MKKELLEKIKTEFPEMYNDYIINNPEGKPRYVAELLYGEQDIYNKLSPDAKELIDIANELFEKSLKERREMHLEHPEYHLQAWDAGYAQLKWVWKKYFPEEFKLFRKKYKELEDRLRPQVYELGFLINENNIHLIPNENKFTFNVFNPDEKNII